MSSEVAFKSSLNLAVGMISSSLISRISNKTSFTLASTPIIVVPLFVLEPCTRPSVTADARSTRPRCTPVPRWRSRSLGLSSQPAPWHLPLQNHACIHSSKTEGITGCDVDPILTGLVGHQVDACALGIDLLNVDIGRDKVVLHHQQAVDDLVAARGPELVPGHRFRGADIWPFAEDLGDRLRFGHIPHQRGRGMS